MSTAAAQLSAAPAQYVYAQGYQGQAGVPMEPVATPGPMYQAAPQQTVTYQTVSTGAAQMQTQGQVTYGAPQVVSVSSPQPQIISSGSGQSVSYVQQASEAQPAVTYMQAPQEATSAGAVMYSAPTMVQGQAQAPVTYTMSPQGAQLGAAYTTGFPSAPSMVAYPGVVTSAAYYPLSVQQAWDNHFGAFSTKDIEKIMLDYDETSIIRVYSTANNQLMEYRGLAQVRQFFTGVFQDLQDLSTLQAPVTQVDEEYKSVFLVWTCTGHNIHLASDTFIFGPDFKIKRQNITMDKRAGGASGIVSQAAQSVTSMGAAAAGAAGAVGSHAAGAAGAAQQSLSQGAAAMSSSVSSAKASKKKKDSKKKLSSKKKGKSGFC